MSSLFLSFSLQMALLLKYRHMCSHSLSLWVQLRGLVCAWVPRIMITAAEKHIFTFQEIRAGNLQAEDLTSSLWLIVELTEKSPPTTYKHAVPYLLHKQGEHLLLPFSTMRDISHSAMTLKLHSENFLTMRHPVPVALLPNFLLWWFISHQEIKSGFIPQRN